MKEHSGGGVSEDVLGHFRQWLQQPGWEDLPERPVALIGGRVTLTSHVIGCTLTVHTDDDDDSLLLAERIQRQSRRYSPRVSNWTSCLTARSS